MAAASAVNTFQTVTQTVQSGEVVVYTAPVGYTGVVLFSTMYKHGISNLHYDSSVS